MEVNKGHPLKIPLISVTLLVFHLDISGNEDIDEHSKNNPLKLVTLFVFHLDISGMEVNEEQL